jgi:hypothetical protein
MKAALIDRPRAAAGRHRRGPCAHRGGQSRAAGLAGTIVIEP